MSKIKIKQIKSSIKRLKNQKTSRTQFTMDEYKHLIKCSTERIKETNNNERLKFDRQKLHYFCIFMMGTGLRVDECMNLNFEDLAVKKSETYDDGMP